MRHNEPIERVARPAEAPRVGAGLLHVGFGLAFTASIRLSRAVSCCQMKIMVRSPHIGTMREKRRTIGAAARQGRKLIKFVITGFRLTLLVVPLACSRANRNHLPGSEAGTGGAKSGDGSSSADATAGSDGDDLLFVPDGLPNTNLDGDRAGGLKLVAFTLVREAKGLNLYAAVTNKGDTPVCEAGMTTYFIDKNDQVVTSAGSVLQSKQFYRLDDGVIIRCIAPGQIAMSAATDLPSDIVIEKLGYLQHRFPAFMIDGLAPIEGFDVSEVQTIARGDSKLYTGKLINRFDKTVTEPSLAIFPMNRVGRPLGVATSKTTTDLPPGGSWSFEVFCEAKNVCVSITDHHIPKWGDA